jgi:uncharacterized protein YyaL (SSP411 family)
MDHRLVLQRIKSGKEKLLAERNKRIPPLVDKTLYTSWNGLLISAFLKAFTVLHDTSLKEFALKSLGRIMHGHCTNHELFHTGQVKAVLDDYIFLIEALISAYEVTGYPGYMNDAVTLMDRCIEKFWDDDDGGFFDTETEVLGIRLKNIEDIPHPSANAVGIILLLKLASITSGKKYAEYAERTIRIFTEQAKEMGIHAAYFFCALDAYFHMLKLTLQTPPDQPLAQAARALYYPYIQYTYEPDAGRIIPCQRDVCYEPVGSIEGLKVFFRQRLNIEPG